MEKKVCVFLADGFEEVEGLTVVDILRRADIKVETVSVTGDREIHGAHEINVQADTLFEEANFENAEMLILPGGMPGTLHLQEHKGLEALLRKFYGNKKYVAAICAAPTIFGKLGFLEGRKATCYPEMEEGLSGANVIKDMVAVDGHVITSRGMGTAIPFALCLIELLIGKEKSEEIRASIIYE
ncbi:DJ-1 family glyoxalase III [Faecalimonas sp.]